MVSRVAMRSFLLLCWWLLSSAILTSTLISAAANNKNKYWRPVSQSVSYGCRRWQLCMRLFATKSHYHQSTPAAYLTALLVLGVMSHWAICQTDHKNSQSFNHVVASSTTFELYQAWFLFWKFVGTAEMGAGSWEECGGSARRGDWFTTAVCGLKYICCMAGVWSGQGYSGSVRQLCVYLAVSVSDRRRALPSCRKLDVW